MQYKFFRNGKEEIVDPEPVQWVALYSDGTSLKQFDDSGLFHQFSEIDQDRLVVFKMVSPSQTYTLLFEKGMKLIHYYDHYVFNANTPEQSHMKVYCFGYQKGREKKIFLITPNETIICSNPEKVRIG